MNDTVLFVAGLGTTMGVCAAVVGFLRGRLMEPLRDICGTDDRAAFWTGFTIVMTLFVPAVFAMHVHPPLGEGEGAVIALSRQIEWGLIGLACTIATVGLVISFFVSPAKRPSVRGA